MTKEELEEGLALVAKATPAPWDEDSIPTGPVGEVYLAKEMCAGKQQLFDSINSDGTIYEEDDGEGGVDRWDEDARNNFKALAWLRNHADELVAAASDARWREIKTEPPTYTEPTVVEVWRVIESLVNPVEVLRFNERKLWSPAGGFYLDLATATHWRPSPKDPP